VLDELSLIVDVSSSSEEREDLRTTALRVRVDTSSVITTVLLDARREEEAIPEAADTTSYVVSLAAHSKWPYVSPVTTLYRAKQYGSLRSVLDAC
jgi:hypothetical protein